MGETPTDGGHFRAGPAPRVLIRLRQMQAVIAELRSSVSPALAGELGRLIPPAETGCVTAGQLGVELPSLTGWLADVVTGRRTQIQLPPRPGLTPVRPHSAAPARS